MLDNLRRPRGNARETR